MDILPSVWLRVDRGMSYILTAAVFSVLVSIFLKLAPRYRIDVPQAVAWNYLAAGGLIAVLWQPPLASLRQVPTPWVSLLGLGLLLPSVFMILGASVRHAGIARSDVAQRLSLLLSLLAAFALFGETLSWPKAGGILLGLAALVCLIWRRPIHADAVSGKGSRSWLYPLVVFVGFAAIDVMLKRVAQTGAPFTACLLVAFALSLVVALVIQCWRAWRHTAGWSLRSFGAGLLLGLLNAGNIVCYVRGHQALPKDPSLVFAGMNIGVVALGAVAGTLIFGERLSRLNVLGVALALLAIGMLAWL